MPNLRPILLGLAASAALAAPAAAAADTAPVDAVNPFIGTAGGGDVFPGPTRPFGMVGFSPDTTRGNQTRSDNPGGYSATSKKIRDFSLTHISGAGCAGSGGDVPLTPYVGAVDTSPSADTTDAKYASTFTRADEAASPGSYRVRLGNGVQTELGATDRTGSARFTFPASERATLLLRTSGSLVGSSDATTTIDAKHRTISGSVTSGNFCGYIDDDPDGSPPDRRSYYTTYFTIELDAPFTQVGTWKDGAVQPGSTGAKGGTGYGDGFPEAGKGSGGWVRFDTTKRRAVNARIGISYVSAANAKRNLQQEQPAGTTLDDVQAATRAAWAKRLGQVAAKGGTDAERETFYTALYHALIPMSLASDTDGRYRGSDGKVHAVGGGQQEQYATFSGWDVYRAQMQLVALLDPDLASDMVQSLYNQSKQDVNGRWDRWTHNSGATSVMSGDPSASVAASVAAFGGTRWDTRAGLRSLVKAATVPTPEDLSPAGRPVASVGQRPSLDKTLALHFNPRQTNAWAGAAETLEEATADFGIAQLARRLGDETTAQRFMTRANWWQNLYDLDATPEAQPDIHGFVQDRNEDRTRTPYDETNGFVEGTTHQYTWMVPFNVDGLFDTMGGDAAAAARLDRFFHAPDGSWVLRSAQAPEGTADLYSDVSNEPSIVTPYLYSWAGQPAKTQETVRETMKQLWSTDDDGIPGNDDLGTMSAWYVFSAAGMFPAIAGTADMVLSSPLFERVTIKRASGQTITIKAPDAAEGNPYVQSLKVDGKRSTKPWLPASFVNDGGTVTFDVGPRPTRWGAAAADEPPSYRDGMQPVVSWVGADTTVAPATTTTAALKLRNVTDAPVAVTLSPSGLPAGVTVSALDGPRVVVPAQQEVTVPLRVSATAEASGEGLVDLGLRTDAGDPVVDAVTHVQVGAAG